MVMLIFHFPYVDPQRFHCTSSCKCQYNIIFNLAKSFLLYLILFTENNNRNNFISRIMSIYSLYASWEKFHVAAVRLYRALANLQTICTFSGEFGWNRATRFVVENEISSVEIAIFIAKMDSGPSITPGARRLYNSNH